MELSIWSQSKIRNKAHLCKLQLLETWELREWKKNGRKQNLGLASGHFCPDHDSWVLHQPWWTFLPPLSSTTMCLAPPYPIRQKQLTLNWWYKFFFFFFLSSFSPYHFGKVMQEFFLGWAAWAPIFKEKKGKDKSLYIYKHCKSWIHTNLPIF